MLKICFGHINTAEFMPCAVERATHTCAVLGTESPLSMYAPCDRALFTDHSDVQWPSLVLAVLDALYLFLLGQLGKRLRFV